MNRRILSVAVLAVSGCTTKGDFYATFDQWQQRLDAKPKTGFPWTQEDMALDRGLGAQAHRHEAFLVAKLKSNPHVHLIFDASPRLRRKYAVPPIQLNEHGAYIPEERQQLWLKCMGQEASQPVSGNEPESIESYGQPPINSWILFSENDDRPK